MQYRIDKTTLLDTLSIWNARMQRKVHLIACGGTALTLMNIKESTKDIDFLIPDITEYKYLINLLNDLGYRLQTQFGWVRDKGFIFDLYPGKKIFMTDLLKSPLDKGNNVLFKEFTHIYIGILNSYDLIVSKLFRCSSVDIDDCLSLIKAKKDEIDFEKLKNRFFETSKYDISDEKNKRNFMHFVKILQKERFNI